MATKKKIPSPPERDPRLGEKTPAYQKWLKKHHPKEYAVKFRNWRNR